VKRGGEEGLWGWVRGGIIGGHARGGRTKGGREKWEMKGNIGGKQGGMRKWESGNELGWLGRTRDVVVGERRGDTGEGEKREGGGCVKGHCKQGEREKEVESWRARRGLGARRL